MKFLFFYQNFLF